MFRKRSLKKEREQGHFTFGILLCVGMTALLFWNEGRAIKTARSLSEGQGIVVSLSADTGIDPANNGKLVHITGEVSTPDKAVRDQELLLEFPGVIKVAREVEMYQWKGRSQGKGSTSSYEYTKNWSNQWINSEKYSSEHKNPSFWITKKEMLANVVMVEEFQLGSSLVRQIRPTEKILPDEAHLRQLTPALQNRAVLHEGGFYIARQNVPDPANPQIGDVKIRFSAANPMTVSVVAQQQESQLIPYQTKAGESLAMLESGNVPASQMFSEAVQANTTMTWILRFFGLGALFVAFRLMFRSLLKFFRKIPGANWLVGSGITVASVVLAVGIALPVIGVGWLFYRPITAIIIIVAVIPFVVAAKWYAAQRTTQRNQQTLEIRVMRAAMRKGGKLTVPEVVVECGVDTDTAQKTLEALVRQGAAGIEVTDSGMLVYAFSDIQNLGQKSSSRDLLE